MKKTVIAGIACLSLLSACSNEADIPEYDDIKLNPVKAMWPDRPLKTIGASNAPKANEFATGLFKKAYAKEQGNTCISPASVFLTLAMTANGDNDECRDEILDILGYGEGADAMHELNAYCNALLVEATDFNGDTQCGFTNSLWHSPEFNLLPSFTDDLKAVFGAADINIWLGDETGRNALNKFVEENTRGMIKEFLKEPQDIDLGILNTTYFKGTWKQKFVSNRFETKSTAEGLPLDAYSRQTDKPFQWSANAAAGIQLNPLPNIGIFAEPGVSYYFNDGTSLSTIYKDHPCNFNLNVGLRFTINP